MLIDRINHNPLFFHTHDESALTEDFHNSTEFIPLIIDCSATCFACMHVCKVLLLLDTRWWTEAEAYPSQNVPNWSIHYKQTKVSIVDMFELVKI